MRFTIPTTTALWASLLATQANAAVFDLQNAHNCGGLFIEELQVTTSIGCTNLPLDGETALSANFISPPADNCFVSFYSDESCNTPLAIVDAIGGEHLQGILQFGDDKHLLIRNRCRGLCRLQFCSYHLRPRLCVA